MANIIFITGPSGVGKSTITEILKSRLPKDTFHIRDLDERGVPDNVNNEWRMSETKYCLDVGVENLKKGISTIAFGYVILEELYSFDPPTDLTVIILTASDETIKTRLEKRYSDPKNVEALHRAVNETPEEFIGFALESAKEFREAAKAFHASILDTTSLSPEEVTGKIQKLIH